MNRDGPQFAAPLTDHQMALAVALERLRDRARATVAGGPSMDTDWAGWAVRGSGATGPVLSRGSVHEFLMTQAEGMDATEARSLFAPLARAAHEAVGGARAGRMAVWVGHHAWPRVAAAVSIADPQRSLLRSSIFVDAAAVDDRVWAAELALRSVATGVVVVDGEGFDPAAVRRLAKAAAEGAGGSNGAGCMALLVRPDGEPQHASGAASCWVVSPITEAPSRVCVKLLHCRGQRILARSLAHTLDAAGHPAWTLETVGGVLRPADAAQPIAAAWRLPRAG